jgi:branched-chain amino acid transport system substrate-binding protein
MIKVNYQNCLKLLLCCLINIPLSSVVIADPDTANEAVKVGCLFPLLGRGGLYGRDSVAAIKIALNDLKTSTKHGYPKLEVLFGDTRSKSLRAVQIARRFIKDDKVDFLCGVVSSQIALEVTEIAKENEVFFIGTDHASPRLISDRLHPYYFRVNNGTRQSMQAGAKYIKAHYANNPNLKIAFIGPDYDYGYQAWDDLRFFLRQETIQFEVVGEFWPKLFETDYSIFVHELNALKPDIIVNGHWGQDFVTFIKQAKPLGLFDNAHIMNFDAGGNYATLAAMGDDMPIGLVLSARHHVNWPETELNRSFVETFREEVGRYPSYAAQGAYAGIIAIAEAVRITSNKNNKDQLRYNLENLVVNLPEDPSGFSSHMDPISHQMLQVQAIGKTMHNSNYKPAKVLLGDWFVHFPGSQLPVVSSPQ